MMMMMMMTKAERAAIRQKTAHATLACFSFILHNNPALAGEIYTALPPVLQHRLDEGFPAAETETHVPSSSPGDTTKTETEDE